MAARPSSIALLVAVLAAASPATAAEVTFADGPSIRRLDVHLAPCEARPVTCIELRWRATDRGSERLRYDLVVEHASGRRVFEGAGGFAAGRTLSAYLEPRGRPACGRYDVTLTVADGQGPQASETRSVVRRSGCGTPPAR